MMRRCVPKCIVPGCTDELSKRFRFPIRNEEVKKIWLDRIGIDTLRHYPNAALNRILICGSHFIKECMGPKRLVIGSLPTINMPGFHDEANIRNSFFSNLITQPVDIAVPSTSTYILHENPPVDAMVCESLYVESSKRVADDLQSETIKRKRKERSLLLNTVRCRKHLLSKEGRKLYNLAAFNKNKFSRLKKRYTTVKQQLKKSADILNSPTFKKFESSHPVVYDFFLSQFREMNKKDRGRRFTVKDKILALSLHKNSPKGYRLLRRIFSLPSVKTLRRLLSKIPFFPGLSAPIFNHLRRSALALPDRDRYCVVLFDEMSIQPGLQYDKSKDNIDGFQNFGDNRSCKFADHALVFLVQGVFRKWKQPVGFMFCEGSTSSSQLAVLIKEVIHNLFECKLTPIATVCDQGASNTAAINILITETQTAYHQMGKSLRAPVLEVDGKEIVPLFDYPHLLKCIRNNLLTKDLLYVHEGIQRRASWDHLVSLYMWDKPTKYLNTLTKLTDQHILPEKIKKMKVSCCTQVFSMRVGKLMHCLIDSGSTVLPKEASDTAYILLFFDKLFDSFNGSKTITDEGHPLRCLIRQGSPHHEFWLEAKKLLTTMSFVCKKTNKFSKPPTLKHWLDNINSIEYLWRKMSTLGYQHIIPRNFNQDAVENFFCCIRSHGVRNINPTCTSFTASFKTFTVNNFTSQKSVSSNCEDDLSVGVLNNLQNFILQSDVPQPVTSKIVLHFDCSAEQPPIYLEAYVAGYVAKKIFKDIGRCETCMPNLLTENEQPEHILITARRFSHKSLLLPSSKFTNIFQKCAMTVANLIPKMCLNNNISKLICAEVLQSVDFLPIVCQDHGDINEKIVKTITVLMLYSWVKHVNKILTGADTRCNKGDYLDPVKTIAHQKFIKRKK